MKLDRTVTIRKQDEEKRLIYCVVLEPDSFDAQEDRISAEEIEKTAHQYAIDSRVIGVQHSAQADASMVESFIAPVDFEVGEEAIRKGSWVMAIRINDDELWEDVKAGEITGLSIGGVGERLEIDG